MRRTNRALKFAKLARRALRLAVRGVIAEHRKTGDPLIVWRRGRVLRVAAHRASTAH
jgi:hypothetical protein